MFKIGDIIMETKQWPNGKKLRTVGYITFIEEDKLKPGWWSVVLNPLSRSMAKPIREKYCEPDGFVYHRPGNTYSDDYGFASHRISEADTVVLGKVEAARPTTCWAGVNPRPGDPGYDLMC